MKLDSKHIDYLIARYLTGEATCSEMQQLEKWMEVAEANKKYFDGIRFAHDKSVASHRMEEFDVDKGWNTLQNKMHEANQRAKKSVETITFNRNMFLRVAAIVILLVGMGSTLYFLAIRNVANIEQLAVYTKDSVVVQKMADKSVISINKNSKISYSKDFGTKNRDIELKGEAYFDVQHDTAMPFVVKTDKTLVKDVGTAFNVKAYDDKDTVEVFVESGIVAFYTEYNPGITLYKGETGYYIKSQDKFFKSAIGEINAAAYATRVFNFKDARLIDVVTQINSIYGQYINLSLGNISDCRITVRFENETIENIANIIAETLGLQVEKIAGGYLLKGESCNSMP